MAKDIDDEKIIISVGVEGNSSGFGLEDLELLLAYEEFRKLIALRHPQEIPTD